MSEYDHRRQALETAFWHRRTELLAEARALRQRTLAQSDLAEAIGIHDLLHLRELMAAGVTPDTVAALAVVPLVTVAWASGHVHPRERDAAMAAAIAAGIPESSEAFAMFSSWLDNRPEGKLLEIWGDYVRALRRRVAPATYDEIRTNLLQRARTIAEAAGGPDDRGEITVEEVAALAQIAQMLD